MTRNVVLVCGGRDFKDEAEVSRVLDEIHASTPITAVVEGGCLGTDVMAGEWAESHSIASASYPAKWVEHGRAAGPIRNRWMLADAKPNLVVAFPGGKGTAHMVKIALAAGVTVFHPLPSPIYINPGKAPLSESPAVYEGSKQ